MGDGIENRNPMIECSENGPYIVRYLQRLKNSKGEKILTKKVIALCRCGGSANKPFCDGTHTKNGFSGDNSSDGSQDTIDTFVGKKITIHDNRGICSHAGFCGVFRFKTGVDPDRADFDEIIKAVRRCPSGALAYSIDGVKHQDQEREPGIIVSKNGPYHVVGGVKLQDISKMEGASEEHYTLCRCGHSKNKPFCDGSHSHVKFNDDRN